MTAAKSDLNRFNILREALRIGMDEGAGSVTFDAIAEGIQISKGGVLHHFRSKKELYRSLLSEVQKVNLVGRYSNAGDRLASAILITASQEPDVLKEFVLLGSDNEVLSREISHYTLDVVARALDNCRIVNQN